MSRVSDVNQVLFECFVIVSLFHNNYVFFVVIQGPNESFRPMFHVTYFSVILDQTIVDIAILHLQKLSKNKNA